MQGVAGSGRGGAARLARWILGAVGTLVVGLAAAWVNHALGPSTAAPSMYVVPVGETTPSARPSDEPCARYTPDSYYDEVVAQARNDVRSSGDGAGSDARAADVIRGATHTAAFAMWVAECGRPGAAQAHEIQLATLGAWRMRLTPHAAYAARDGTECRQVDTATKLGDRWYTGMLVLCRRQGRWQLLSNTAIAEQADQDEVENEDGGEPAP